MGRGNSREGGGHRTDACAVPSVPPESGGSVPCPLRRMTRERRARPPQVPPGAPAGCAEALLLDHAEYFAGVIDRVVRSRSRGGP